MWLVLFSFGMLALLGAAYFMSRITARKQAMKLSLGCGVGARVERPPTNYAPVDADADQFRSEPPSNGAPSSPRLSSEHMAGYAGGVGMDSSSDDDDDDSDDGGGGGDVVEVALDDKISKLVNCSELIDEDSELTPAELELAMEKYLGEDVDLELAEETPPKLAPPPSA